jgi:hypothetical protein
MSGRRKTGKVPERLAETQQRFAAHIRNPERHPAPADVEDRRMRIYRGLFFRNIRDFLSGNFPVLRRLYGDAEWDVLVRDFYREHRARTPLFPEIAREFLQYLQDQRQDRKGDPPFMLELAHYEWVELALALDENEIDEVPADREGDLLQGTPVLSPLAWTLSYRFPVHRIRPDYQPQEPPAEPTHLLVYRDRQDDVKFMQLNALSVLLLQSLKDSPTETGQVLLERMAGSLEHPDPGRVVAGGRQLLEDLRDRDVILGTRPDTRAAAGRTGE